MKLKPRGPLHSNQIGRIVGTSRGGWANDWDDFARDRFVERRRMKTAKGGAGGGGVATFRNGRDHRRQSIESQIIDREPVWGGGPIVHANKSLSVELRHNFEINIARPGYRPGHH